MNDSIGDTAAKKIAECKRIYGQRINVALNGFALSDVNRYCAAWEVTFDVSIAKCDVAKLFTVRSPFAMYLMRRWPDICIR